MEQYIEVVAEWDNVARLLSFADQVEQVFQLSEEQSYLVRLVIEEIATNIIKYSYNASAPGLIQVSCTYDDQVLRIVLRDHGNPFDPRDLQEPDFEGDVATRQVGGLGLYLVLTMVDDLSYHHDPQTGWNELVVMKSEKPYDR